jgi:hypothetical protein
MKGLKLGQVRPQEHDAVGVVDLPVNGDFVVRGTVSVMTISLGLPGSRGCIAPAALSASRTPATAAR